MLRAGLRHPSPCAGDACTPRCGAVLSHPSLTHHLPCCRWLCLQVLFEPPVLSLPGDIHIRTGPPSSVVLKT